MSDIHWAAANNGRFSDARDWAGGVVPGASDDAILDAAGDKFIVASTGAQTVAAIQLAANAVLQIDSGQFSILDGTGDGENAGLISVGDGSTLAVGGAVDNAGTIALDSYGDTSRLLVLSDTTLTGDGQITFSKGADTVIQAGGAGAHTLVNQDDTITGGGMIEARAAGGRLEVINGAFGVIGASFTASRGTGRLVNHGVVEAVNGAQEQISDATVTGRDGILFVGQSSSMSISGSRVSGQALKVAKGGALYLGSGSVALSGVVQNSGSVSVASATELLLSGAVSFVGGGNLSLGGQLEATSPATFRNGDILTAGGVFGSDQISWVNLAGGVIKTISYVDGLTIDVGANTFVNAGTIGGLSGEGGITITGAVDNSGYIGTADGGVTVTGTLINSGTLDFLTAQGSVESSGLIEDITIAGTLVNTGTIYEASGDAQVQGAVTGDGVVVLDEGGAGFGSSFAENVQFEVKGGVLSLAQSQGYTGQISGFTTNGASKLFLGDIAYVGAGEATYSGTTSSGVLTVTDGTHTAQIDFVGDYTHAGFTASSAFGGGTEITATARQTPSMPPIAHFSDAMASLAAGTGVSIHAPRPSAAGLGVLAPPHIWTT